MSEKILQRVIDLRIGVIVISLLTPMLCFAQENYSLIRTIDRLNTASEILVSDSLSIVPGSIRAYIIPDSIPINHCFTIHSRSILWNSDFCRERYGGESISISYRVFHLDLEAPYSHLDSLQMAPLLGEEETYIGFDFSPFDQDRSQLSLRNLNYSGSFSRGLTFGNNQSLVLNSAFNLQMAGTIGEDIEIRAAISDENIPIQPEGSTRQIQEFDRVFIELSRNQHRLLAGDIELQNPEGRFIKYRKKLKGLNYQYEDYLGGGVLRIDAAASISQGKFSRQQIAVTEGNQGPYRLSGAGGERFIVILAGTENIILDGRPLVRGLENDYIIDYNSAEIIFTFNTMITKDSRVIAEFEYIDQNYSRSLITVNSTYSTQNTEYYFRFYSEQDSRSPSGLQDLSAEDLEILEMAGNELEALFSNSITPLEGEFDPNRVSYELRQRNIRIGGRDSTVQILVFSQDPEAQLYSAGFTDLGQGNGNYQRRTDPRNGRIYEYVEPDSVTGAMRGRFEPVNRLFAPEKQQMTSVGVLHRFSANTQLGGELTLSNFDRNRFSDIGNSENLGLGSAINFSTIQKLGSDSIPWKLSHSIDYEFTGTNFNVLNPYRSPEFERDWNYVAERRLTEHLVSGNIGISKGENFKTQYQFTGLFREDEYTGMRNLIDSRLKVFNTSIHAIGNLVSTEDMRGETYFFRPSVSISRPIELLEGGTIGYEFDMEENRFTGTESDSLSASSFRNISNKLFLEQVKSEQFRWRISYTKRSDDLPTEGTFRRATNADQYRITGRFSPLPGQNVLISTEIRELKVTASGIENFQPRRTFLNRVEWNGNVLNGALRYGNIYEAGSGQEPRVEFEYREVPPGEGQYTWIDLNGDGIKQINEFFLTPNPEERTFIRLPIITDEFISVNSVSIDQNLNWDPRNISLGESDLAALVKKLSTISTLRIQRRSEVGDRTTDLNPWKTDTRDTNIVTLNLSTRHTLFFNRGNPIYDIQFSILHNNSVTEQVTGSESRGNSEYSLRVRWNISRRYTQIVEGRIVENNGSSETFESNNFNIEGWSCKAESSFLISSSARIRGWYEFDKRNNTLGLTGEAGNFHRLNTELSLRGMENSVIQGRLSYINASTSGPLNTPAAILMLSGLSPGNNFQATVTVERQLTEHLRLSVQYSGRKPGDNPIVHTGGLNMTASF